ncbi:DUF1800 family protein [Desulfolutivibrio sulfoxidireducens]|nr:DUF1800 family protein [Desulfolutivibrio sulfoxidireducens]
MGRGSTTFFSRRRRVFSPGAPGPSGCVLAACLLLLWPAGPSLAGEMSPEHKITHVIDRLTYGPAPGDIERVRAMGVAAFIEEQLEPDALPESRELAARLESLGTVRLGAVDLFREYGPTPDTGGGLGPSQVLAARDRAGVVAREAVQARLLRAMAAPGQLRELLVDFWYNHFNVDAGHGLARIWAGAYEREAIRPHAMGRFLDLLAATAMHPAMLIYLENWRNVAPRDDGGGDGEAISPDSDGYEAKAPDREADAERTGGLDETYAGTLLAVHTLGDDAAFAARDRTALARVFTGWRLGAPRSETDKNGFFFDQAAHDPTDKVFLGKTIPGGGIAEGAAALRILAGHPATAKHVCRKLAAFFLAGEPSRGLVGRLAEIFLRSEGDIRAVLRALFADPEFFDESRYAAGVKTPLRTVVSAVRAIGTPPDDVTPLAGVLARMGTPLFHCPDPAGYPGPGAFPTSRDMAARVAFAVGLVSGELPLWREKPPGLAVEKLLSTLGTSPAPEADKPAKKGRAARTAPKTSPRRDPAAILAGPGFLRY